MCVCSVAQSWTIASQPALHVEFSRQEYWSGLPLPSPRDLLDLGIELEPLASPAWEGGFFTIRVTWKAQCGLTKRIHKDGDSQAHVIARHPAEEPVENLSMLPMSIDFSYLELILTICTLL